MSIRVGIIVNPSSGRDIRRLLARASVFPSGEKINVVLRLLAALGAMGIGESLIMPDRAGIAAAIRREAEAAGPGGRALPAVRPLAMPVTDTVEDTHRAVALMREAGVGAIVILGGDGTHRAAAAHCGDTPLLALSTGTNNAFPELREATTAGLALALALEGSVPRAVALRRNKLLRVVCGERRELALVDVCVAHQPFLGARAVWQTDDLSQLFVTFGEPRGIGLSAIAGWALPVARSDPWGAQLTFGPGSLVTAPIAPGLVETLPVASAERLSPGVPVLVELRAAGTVALDGERELELDAGDRLSVTLEPGGPLTIDVEATLSYAARHRLLTQG